MRVLVLGGGGREHALIRKLRRDDPKAMLFAIPGNPGIAKDATCVTLSLTDLHGIVAFARENQIDWTFVGGEELLSLGIVDLFQSQGLKVFGPTKAAAKIETSKRFAKELMSRYGVPTAKYRVIGQEEAYEDYLNRLTLPIVVKADGLAKGKGVIIAKTHLEARNACQLLLCNHPCVVIEEYLEGIEFSLMCLVVRDRVVPLELAQDYKRAYDHHQGPNTGGMGAYSPVPFIPKQVVREAMSAIMNPIAQALCQENTPFEGILYGGLMWTKTGVKVIEFNARFGDPETEVVLPRLKTKLISAIEKLRSGQPVRLRFSREMTVGVVLASKGYPGAVETGLPISLPEDDPLCFQMGTDMSAGGLITAGGRVAILVAQDKTLALAREAAYKKVIAFPNDSLFYRTDIALPMSDQ